MRDHMKNQNKKLLLTHAVLASTLFTASAYADTIVVAPSGGLTTGANGPNITVTTTGNIAEAAKSAVIFDSANGKLVIDPGNANAGNKDAVASSFATGHGVEIQNAGTNAIIINGAHGAGNLNTINSTGGGGHG